MTCVFTRSSDAQPRRVIFASNLSFTTTVTAFTGFYHSNAFQVGQGAFGEVFTVNVGGSMAGMNMRFMASVTGSTITSGNRHDVFFVYHPKAKPGMFLRPAPYIDPVNLTFTGSTNEQYVYWTPFIGSNLNTNSVSYRDINPTVTGWVWVFERHSMNNGSATNFDNTNTRKNLLFIDRNFPIEKKLIRDTVFTEFSRFKNYTVTSSNFNTITGFVTSKDTLFTIQTIVGNYMLRSRDSVNTYSSKISFGDTTKNGNNILKLFLNVKTFSGYLQNSFSKNYYDAYYIDNIIWINNSTTGSNGNWNSDGGKNKFYYEITTVTTSSIVGISKTFKLIVSTISGDVKVYPLTAIICETQTQNFNITNSGVDFKWYRNNILIASNTRNITTSIAGNYFCVYSATGVGVITTSSAILTVNSLPGVQASISKNTICAGEEVFFSQSGTALSYQWSPAVVIDTRISPTISGVYTLTGTSNGCSRSSIVSLTVKPLPVITALGFTVCNTVASVNASAFRPTGGSWLGTAISNNIFIPSIAGVGTVGSTYSLTVNGCAATAAVAIEVLNCVRTVPSVNTSTGINTFTGINTSTGVNTSTGTNTNTGVNALQSPQKEMDFSIKPNPNNGTFTLELPISSGYILYNRYGTVAAISTEPKPIHQLSNLLPGLYLIKIGEKVKKIVVE